MMQAASTCAECGGSFWSADAAPRPWCSVYCETAGAREAAIVAAARAEGEAAGRAAERARVLALVRAAYEAERESERRYGLVTTPSSALDVLEQRIEPGDYLSVVVPLDDYDAIRARLTIAEAALAAAQAELAQARADLRVLAGLAWAGIDERFAFSAAIIGDDVVAAVDDAEDAVQKMPDADVLAAVRRALGV